MRIKTSHQPDGDIKAVSQHLSSLFNGNQPDLLICYLTQQHFSSTVISEIQNEFSHSCVIGCTSCRAVMDQDGYHALPDGELVVMAIDDPSGAYGVGYCDTENDPRYAGRVALIRALKNGGRAGELPAFILLHASPGAEERVLEGIYEILGNSVPVIGGSAADNQVVGNWGVFCSDGYGQHGVAIAVCYPDCEVAYAFSSGYDPTEKSGVVSQAVGRHLIAIDGEPAAKVYQQWLANPALCFQPGDIILPNISLTPFGRTIDKVSGFPFFMLSHPESVTEDFGITLFSEVYQGERIFLMNASKEMLISRAGRIVNNALDTIVDDSTKIIGALFVYCAGTMMTVEGEMEQVVHNIAASIEDLPFIGAFTFGEQGQLPDKSNGHGNLMISTLLFLETT